MTTTEAVMTKPEDLIAERIRNIVAVEPAHLHRTLDKHLKRLPFGWHDANDISTVTGLAGTFQWLEDPTHPAVITFTPSVVGAQGTLDGSYALVGVATLETGTFHAVPNNACIGWAFIILQPNGHPERMATFAGVLTNAQGVIYVALLNHVNNQGPTQPPFSAIRLA